MLSMALFITLTILQTKIIIKKIFHRLCYIFYKKSLCLGKNNKKLARNIFCTYSSRKLMKIAIEYIFTGTGPVVFGFSPVSFWKNIREKF